MIDNTSAVSKVEVVAGEWQENRSQCACFDDVFDVREDGGGEGCKLFCLPTLLILTFFPCTLA
jgi:hypothetical protein